MKVLRDAMCILCGKSVEIRVENTSVTGDRVSMPTKCGEDDDGCEGTVFEILPPYTQKGVVVW